MKTQHSLTITAVTGHDSYTYGSMLSIEHSYHELKPYIQDLRCLLISPNKPDNLPDFIQYIPCKPFSYLEYNLFVLYQLGDLIDTDFALIVQSDGFVISGSNWRDEFFDYDFIGAPIPQLFAGDGEPGENYTLCLEDDEHFDYHGNRLYAPMNGGFSLRSKRLLIAPRDLNLTVPINVPNSSKMDEPLTISWDVPTHHEDMALSILYRECLENEGLKFPSIYTASLFSIESSDVQNMLGINLRDVLGCHNRMWQFVAPKHFACTDFKGDDPFETVYTDLNRVLVEDKGFKFGIPQHLSEHLQKSVEERKQQEKQS